MRRAILVFVLVIALLLIWTSPSQAATTNHVWVGDYIDRTILSPVHSVITGDMLVHNRDIHHIPIIDQLVLLKIETNLGSWTGGQPFTRYNNFGCVKYFSGRTALMGTPVPGYFWYWGSRWYRWSTPAQGMHGWGNFIEHWNNGAFLAALKRGDWYTVARYYNGVGPNATRYAGWCRTLDARYTALFRATGEYPLTVAGWTP